MIIIYIAIAVVATYVLVFLIFCFWVGRGYVKNRGFLKKTLKNSLKFTSLLIFTIGLTYIANLIFC